MRRLACLFLICLAPFSYALETFQTPQSSGIKYYLYVEGGQWHVDAESLDADQFPQVETALNFPSERAARAYIKKIGAHPSSSRNAMAGRELRSRNGGELWTATNQWDWSWEVKFGEWVKRELHTGWWKQYGIATDCADVFYSVRWIFARINGLPMANTMRSGEFLTNRSVKAEWETLPTAPEWYNDQKFLAGLHYVFSHTYTQSLWKDSYPIEINSTALIPGTFHLHLDGMDSGHTLLVNSVGTKAEELPVEVLYSTIPSEIRELWSGVFLDEFADSRGVGFLHLRWPQWNNDVVSLVAPEQMPHYSVEEFDSNFVQSPRYAFWEEVFFRLNPNADFNRIAVKTLSQILAGFQARVKIVEDGYAACSAVHCAEGSHEYEMWSTPTRDGRLAGQTGIFDQLLGYATDYSQFKPLLDTVIVQIPNQFPLDLRQALEKWRYGEYSSDPNDSIGRRWGYQN